MVGPPPAPPRWNEVLDVLGNGFGLVPPGVATSRAPRNALAFFFAVSTGDPPPSSALSCCSREMDGSTEEGGASVLGAWGLRPLGGATIFTDGTTGRTGVAVVALLEI